MAKIFNRALWLGGEVKKVGTPTVRVLDYDNDDKVLRASGATVPTDADAGYAKGCIFIQTDGGVGSVIYINEGTAASADFNSLGGPGGGGGIGTLNQAYENGRTIEVDSGAITVTDAQATAHTFDIDKTGTGSGDIFNIKFENAATGRMFYLDMDDAIAANAIVIDSGGTARTGADVVFTDDSTGTHIVLDVNSSGAGKSTALDWTDSYAGSNASIGVLLTMGNSNGLSSEGLKIVRGTGARTAPAINIDDDSTGNTPLIDIDLATGVYTGDVINVKLAAAATTGAVFQLDMDAAVAYRAMYIDFGAGTRTVDAIEVKADGAGNKGLLLVTESNTGSGPLMDIDVTGIGSGAVLDITYSAADTGDALKVTMADNVAGGALVITGAGGRTDNLVDIVSSETGSVDGMVLLQTNGVFTGHMLTVHSDGAATTGGLLHLDLDAGVAYKAITFDHAGARTVETILVTFDGTFGSGAGGTFLNADITMTGSSASPFVDVDITGAYTGNVLDVLIGASLATGDVIKVDLGATAVSSQALVIASGAMARTTALIGISDAGTHASGAIFDIDSTGIRAGIVFDLDDTAAATGNVFDYATDSASTGTIFNINLTNAVAAKLGQFTLAGTRTAAAVTFADSSAGAVAMFLLDIDSTSSGHLFDVDVDTVFTGNVFDVTFATAAATGDVFKAAMGTNVAGSAIVLTGTGSRTDDLIKIDDDSTGNSHIFDINMSGVYTGNVLDITFATDAATGEAIMLAMGTNVAGRAIAVTSAGTGVSGEGNVLDVTHTGALVAGADVVNLTTSGALSSTSNVLAIETTNGVAGSYAIYINAGNDMEAIHVDAGTVVIDESITAATYIDGAGTLTATMLELNNVADISGRLVVAGATETAAPTTHDSRIILLDTLAGSVVTLPAATGSGAVYRCIVSVVATSNSHIIKVTGDDVMYGAIWLADSDTAGTTTAFVTAADSDTVTLNRTTTGSVTIGEWVEFVDVAADKWAVRGFLTNSGNGGTPFSATV